MNQVVTARRSGPLRVLLAGAVLFLLSLLLTAGAKGYRDLRAAREREAVLEERMENTQSRIEELEHRLLVVTEDPASLERLAREELGMVRETDVVFVLPEDP